MSTQYRNKTITWTDRHDRDVKAIVENAGDEMMQEGIAPMHQGAPNVSGVITWALRRASREVSPEDQRVESGVA